MSKMEQIIGEIEDYIEGCNYLTLSSTMIKVNKEEILQLLTELRLRTPDEVKKYQKIISNKDAIINDAKDRAEKMIADAKAQTNELVSEHEIMQQAYAQANQIVEAATSHAQDILNSATSDANSIRIGAIQYTDDMLANLQELIKHTEESTKTKYESFLNTIKTNYEIVTSNRNELNPPEQEEDINELIKDVEGEEV